MTAPLAAGPGAGWLAAGRPAGLTPRRSGLGGFERVLTRAGLAPVAGVDEAGRGACAGPLVVAAVMLRQSRMGRLTGLADSKALTPEARMQAYGQVMDAALDWHVVVIGPAEIDRTGLHVCNVAGMRRALAGLARRPGYVLTDGFPVRGLAVPSLAMWKGDQVAACVAAASVVAKVTRDALMCELHLDYPDYGFDQHKGYSTPAHMRALTEHGPCSEHRRSFVNVRQRSAGRPQGGAAAAPAAGPGGFTGASEASRDSQGEPGAGHNGPIVETDEHGWPTAGTAAMARGA